MKNENYLFLYLTYLRSPPFVSFISCLPTIVVHGRSQLIVMLTFCLSFYLAIHRISETDPRLFTLEREWKLGTSLMRVRLPPGWPASELGNEMK